MNKIIQLMTATPEKTNMTRYFVPPDGCTTPKIASHSL
jgi:hypothetical protein